MDPLDVLKKQVKMRLIKYVIMFAVPALLLIIIIALIYELIIGSGNSNQSTAENTAILTGEQGINNVFEVLCNNCDIEQSSEKTGIMGSEFTEKMSELINLYNSLEYKTERIDELDYILLTSTITYGKKMEAEIFQDSSKFGNWLDEDKLTNRDIDQFARVSDITVDNAQRFYKWAAVMLGTPYSLPDINFRGLTGNLITGKVETKCVSGSDNSSETQQLGNLISDIVEVEMKLSGETVTKPGFWESIFSVFGKKYDTNEETLKKKLEVMFANLGNPDSKYADLEAYINLENYNPNLQCGSGQKRQHTYTKFMNYEQYKVYLEEVYIPQNYINCDECIHKNASDYNKSVLAKTMLKEILDLAEFNRDYLSMTKIDYSNQSIESGDLAYFSSVASGSCIIKSDYGLRGQTFHYAIDITASDPSLYAIANGVVEQINIYTTENFWNYYNKVLGSCPPINGVYINSGIEIIIRHEINGKIYRSNYLHLDPEGIEVKEGDVVKRGDKIANIGNTGCSTGPHLHFELTVDGEPVNPSILFKDCVGSTAAEIVKVKTTDNFVTPEKCMMNDLTLDEVIAGMIKNDYAGASGNPEYVKSLAIVIRTKLMNETNWCNSPISADVNIDIENNSSDLMLYNYVIDTQGMVLNYSGTLLSNVDYAKFPCEVLTTAWQNVGNTARVLNALGITDPGRENWTDEFIAEVNRELRNYNSGCTNYNRAGQTVTIQFDTISDEVKERYGSSVSDSISVASSAITETSRFAQDKFSTLAALYKSNTQSYTKILYDFYYSKNKVGSEYEGAVDLTTSPGLIDAKTKALKRITNISQSFTYGETLPGTTNIPTGNMSDAELETINQHIINYIDTAEANAIAKGDINPKRARVMAAAYWLIYNPFYRVQYEYGGNFIHRDYEGIGWDPSWSATRGLECQNFVLWSLWNAGAKSIYPDASILQKADEFLDNGDNYFTVEQVLEAGIEVGDVLRKSDPDGSNGPKHGHWAIVMAVNTEEWYIEVAHAVTREEDTTITRYYIGEEFNFQHLYKLSEFYQDEAWEAGLS